MSGVYSRDMLIVMLTHKWHLHAACQQWQRVDPSDQHSRGFFKEQSALQLRNLQFTFPQTLPLTSLGRSPDGAPRDQSSALCLSESSLQVIVYCTDTFDFCFRIHYRRIQHDFEHMTRRAVGSSHMLLKTEPARLVNISDTAWDSMDLSGGLCREWRGDVYFLSSCRSCAVS